MIITESDYLNQMKKQVKAQIHYMSQKNSRTTAYLLHNIILEIKKTIYDHQQRQALFQENVLDYKVNDNINIEE